MPYLERPKGANAPDGTWRSGKIRKNKNCYIFMLSTLHEQIKEHRGTPATFDSRNTLEKGMPGYIVELTDL